MKLDYDMLYFKIRSMGKDFVEIVVNTQNGRTAFVDKHRGKVILWPEFLLNVHSVELSSSSSQNIKERPFDAAGNVNTPYSFLHPLLIRDNWMQVELWDDSFKKIGLGWIRWKKEDQLLVRYSLLS